MSKPFNRRTKFIRTNEDWYPAFKPNWRPKNPEYHNPLNDWAVCVSLHYDGKKQGYRVAIWGGDDFGLEKYGMKKGEATDLFNSLEDWVKQADLKRRGFVYC